jgi:hypothetical protein
MAVDFAIPAKDLWLLMRHPRQAVSSLQGTSRIVLLAIAIPSLSAFMALKVASLVVWEPSLAITPLFLHVSVLTGEFTALAGIWAILPLCWHMVARMLRGKGQYQHLLVAPGYAIALNYATTLVFAFLAQAQVAVEYPASLLWDVVSNLLRIWFILISVLAIGSVYDLGLVRSSLVLVAGLVIFVPLAALLFTIVLGTLVVLGPSLGLPVFSP